MVTILARWVAAEGNEEKVAEGLRDYVPMVLTEPGCIAFDVYRGIDNPRLFVLVELYADRAAVDAHIASDHFNEVAVKELRPLLESREVEFLEKCS